MKLFFDMDGTLSVFNKDAGPDKWAAPGYARGLDALDNVVRSVRFMLKNPTYYGEEVEIYILSAVVSMDFAVKDKKYWLKEKEIFIPESRLIFVPYGSSKSKALEDAGIETESSDLFIDDFTKNLYEMQNNSNLTPVKLINGINDTHHSWQGARVSAFSSPKAIVDTLMGISWVNRSGIAA